MKLWVDDVRTAPAGYYWAKSVNEAKRFLEYWENNFKNFYDRAAKFSVEVIDLDHDAGEFAKDGGDFIKLLDWMEETGRDYPIKIHSMNAVGRANMLAIAEKNGWKVIN